MLQNVTVFGAKVTEICGWKFLQTNALIVIKKSGFPLPSREGSEEGECRDNPIFLFLKSSLPIPPLKGERTPRLLPSTLILKTNINPLKTNSFYRLKA